MSTIYLRKVDNTHVLQTESGETVYAWGKHRPSSGDLGRTLIKLYRDNPPRLVDELKPLVYRNRCRRHKAAAGQVAVEIWMSPEQRNKLGAYAIKSNKSRNAVVLEWIDSL